MGIAEQHLIGQDGQEHFYTFLNGGNYTEEHWDQTRDVLGTADQGGNIVAGWFVSGDAHNSVRRSEAYLNKDLTEEELHRLGMLGISAVHGPLPIEV